MFPRMALIHNQDYNSVRLGDVEEEFKKRLKALMLSTEEIRGKRVGLAVGSRGIDKIHQIVRMTVEAVRKSGGEPYIFGAMGSHGNGTARGQREILASLGVTEEETGAPVLCSADTALWGVTPEHGYRVYGNVLCDQFDAIVLINRVKMHTDFEDVTEGGVLKLMAIGIGGPAGCQAAMEAVSRGHKVVLCEKSDKLAGLKYADNADFKQNIARYREQLDKIGFSFDWHREVRTCDPSYYKWTQWAFLEMFKHYYDRSTDKAEPIEKLVARFEAQGTEGLDAACTQEMRFTADEWKSKTEEEREQILQNYRLAFRADTMVNWCPQLGTVLANDEVKDGLSERGGFPVEQKQMKQWLLRVTAYAQRMLDGLERLEWSDSLKEIQRNWIGRSEGAQVFFDIQGSDRKLEIFTTRPDTIFGVTFMVIAPEHEWVGELTTPENRDAVERYIAEARKRSGRERIAGTRRVSGVATGSCAVVALFILSGISPEPFMLMGPGPSTTVGQ